MDFRTKTGRTVMHRIAPVVLVAMLGVGAAACGSSGTKVQNNPGGQAPTPTTGAPSTQGSSSGGAGF